MLPQLAAHYNSIGHRIEQEILYPRIKNPNGDILSTLSTKIFPFLYTLSQSYPLIEVRDLVLGESSLGMSLDGSGLDFSPRKKTVQKDVKPSTDASIVFKFIPDVGFTVRVGKYLSKFVRGRRGSKPRINNYLSGESLSQSKLTAIYDRSRKELVLVSRATRKPLAASNAPSEEELRILREYIKQIQDDDFKYKPRIDEMVIDIGIPQEVLAERTKDPFLKGKKLQIDLKISQADESSNLLEMWIIDKKSQEVLLFKERELPRIDDVTSTREGIQKVVLETLNAFVANPKKMKSTKPSTLKQIEPTVILETSTPEPKEPTMTDLPLSLPYGKSFSREGQPTALVAVYVPSRMSIFKAREAALNLVTEIFDRESKQIGDPLFAKKVAVQIFKVLKSKKTVETIGAIGLYSRSWEKIFYSFNEMVAILRMNEEMAKERFFEPALSFEAEAIQFGKQLISDLTKKKTVKKTSRKKKVSSTPKKTIVLSDGDKTIIDSLSLRFQSLRG